MPKSAIKRHIQEYFSKKWDSRWKKQATCRQTKIFISNAGSNVTKGILNLNRQLINRLIQTITGHCELNRHLSLLQIKDDPKCRLAMQ